MSGQDSSSRARRAEQMYGLMREWEGSELSQKEFCRQQGIKLAVFGYWLRRYREESRTDSGSTTGFVSVELAAGSVRGAWAEIIYPNGTRLLIKERVGIGFLQGLLPQG